MLTLGLKEWPARICHKEELLPGLLIIGAEILPTVGTIASNLTLKGLKTTQAS
jgi:hypothetical protein